MSVFDPLPILELPRRSGRILVVSDLHLDFHVEAGRDPFAEAGEEAWRDLDLLLVAGDLSNKPKTRWPASFDLIARHLPLDRVAVLPGNHDHYDFRLDGDDRLREIAEAAGVHFAQGREIRLGGVRLVCATLWTDMALGGASVPLNEIAAQQGSNDYRHIRLASGGWRRIRPADVIALHRRQRAWLAERLAAPFDGRTVAVTHHAPIAAAVRLEDRLPFCYASDLEGLVRDARPDAWLFGHVHADLDLDVGGVRVSCVSIGYPFEVSPDDVRRRVAAISAACADIFAPETPAARPA